MTAEELLNYISARTGFDWDKIDHDYQDSVWEGTKEQDELEGRARFD